MKNENDVKALQDLIAKKNSMGAHLPEDLDDQAFYEWDEEGRLVRLRLPECGITGHLSLKGFPELERLNVAYNPLDSLDVSACPKLKYLNCTDSGLHALNVTYNFALNILYCGWNQLAVLDVSTCPALEKLLCNDNRLTQLDLSKNTVLKELNAKRNVCLTKLDVLNNCRLDVLLHDKDTEVVTSMTKERAQALLAELLKQEAVYNLLNLTRMERENFQRMVKEALTGRIKIPTPDGELLAYAGTDPEHPGICVMLKPEGMETEILAALTEYTLDDGLRTVVYGDAMSDDFTHVEYMEHIENYRESAENREEDR